METLCVSEINAIDVRFHHLREQFRPNVIKNVTILGIPNILSVIKNFKLKKRFVTSALFNIFLSNKVCVKDKSIVQALVIVRF